MKKNRQQRRQRLAGMMAMVPPAAAQAQSQPVAQAGIDKHYPRAVGEPLGRSGAHTLSVRDQIIQALPAAVIPSTGHGNTMAVAPWPELPAATVKVQRPYAKPDDPLLDYYDKALADLTLASFDNDQLGNAAYLHYDDHTLLPKWIDHTRDPVRNPRPLFTPIALMTAVKERLRWLDRQLRRTTWERDQALAELAALKAK
jgi:hypothetical protein